MASFRSDILVLTAKVEEFHAFKAACDSAGIALKKLQDDPPLWHGQFKRQAADPNAFQLFASHQSQQGMAAAAALTARLVDKLAPQYVVMLGIAAGFDKRGQIYRDVLISERVVNYQAGKLLPAVFHSDRDTRNLDNGLKQRIAAFVGSRTGSYNAHLGWILTGSPVVANPAEMKRLSKQYRKAVGVEMEAWGVFEAVDLATEPKPKALIIKGVSDFGGTDKNDSPQAGAARNSADFFLEFAQKQLQPIGLNHPTGRVTVTGFADQGARGNEALIAALDETRKSASFITVVGKSFLAVGTTQEVRGLRRALVDALDRGVKVRGITLNPTSSEAKIRSGVESPKVEGPSLLSRDAAIVEREIERQWGSYKNGQLRIRRTSVGLSMNLWVFDESARMEALHFGRQKHDRARDESPLCGFSQVWCQSESPEYEILHNHFEELWRRTETVDLWPVSTERLRTRRKG